MAQLIDLTGLRLGWLEVICRDENNRHNRSRWKCLCDCGKETVVDGARLRIGMTKSCGRYRAVATRKAHELDIEGLRKGSMVAVQRLELIHKKGWLWLVRCDCGEEREVTSGAFNAGGYMSCGCKKAEAIGNANRTHGKSGTYAYWLRGLAKKRARDRNVPCNLSLEFVERLISETKVCPYLGVPIKSNKGKLSWNSATLDRVSPKLGYVESNVMLISHRANTIKNDATPDEIMKVAVGFAKRLAGLPEAFREVGPPQVAIATEHPEGTMPGYE